MPEAEAFKGFKFRGDDAGDGLGEGTLHLDVNPTTHAVTGEIDGALGSLVVTGTRDKDDITFSIRPKTPGDDSFFGTGSAKVDGAKVTGTMRVSLARANVIREASFSLDPK